MIAYYSLLRRKKRESKEYNGKNCLRRANRQDPEDMHPPGLEIKKTAPIKGRNLFWLLGEDLNLEPSG